MSVLGEKGGVGIGNLLNAISLVLNRFVNHDNALRAASTSPAAC